MSRSCARPSRSSSAARCVFAVRRPSSRRATARPILNALSCSAFAAMPTPLQSAPEGRPRLLIVDDDVLITDTLAFALGAEFEVLACESRPHAIDLLRQLPEPPQLALVDLGLPPTPHVPDQGFQLIADLLAHSPGMRIFVLSGQNDAAHARHARALGAAEFIAKPCDPAALKKILARALAVREAELRSTRGGEGVVGERAAAMQ